MSFDWLRNILVTKDTTGAVQVDKAAAIDAVQPKAEPGKVVANPDAGQVTDHVFDQIIAAIESADLLKSIYLEFAESIHVTDKTIPDEKRKFIAAFSTQASGTTVDILKTSATDYINVLSDCEVAVTEDINEQFKSRVVTKKDAAEALGGRIEALAQEVDALEAKMTELVDERFELDEKAALEKGDIQKVANNFGATIAAFRNKINDDLTKIEDYLV